MANELPQNQGPGPNSGKTHEMELDDVLSQATLLAAELNEEIGGAGEPAASPAPDPLTEVKASTSDSLECELNELERLVASTSKEIAPESTDSEAARATDPPPASDPAASPVPPAPPAASAHVMPDFMSEFTDQPQVTAETPVSSKPSPQTRQTAAPASPATAAPATKPPAKAGVVSSVKVGVVGAPSVEPAAAATPETTETLVDTERLAKAAPEGSAADGSEEPASRLFLAAIAVCSKAVRLLEAMDRPFRWLGLAPRRLAGWLAIVTLVAASVVYVLSLW